MQTDDSQKEITDLKFQIDDQEKKLDMAIKNDLLLGESKRLLHEIRLLRERLSKLKDQDSGDLAE